MTGLPGNFPLTMREVDVRVYASRGAYLLGNELNADGSMPVRYVGRADDDLNKRLKQWIGKYKYFASGHFSTVTANYEAECGLYHHFGGANGRLDNEIHPAKPPFSTCSCPNRCGS